jgi:putative SOS response-associated peptidase YedK
VGTTFAVITTDANVKMGEIHNRQPVVLEPREYKEWLAESERQPVHLLWVLPEEDLVVDTLDVAKIKPKAEPPEPGLFDAV